MGFQGVEVGTENRPKIDPKRRCQRERVLASILAGFGTVLGSKLSPKIEPNWEEVDLGGAFGGQGEPQEDSATGLEANVGEKKPEKKKGSSKGIKTCDEKTTHFKKIFEIVLRNARRIWGGRGGTNNPSETIFFQKKS